MTVLALTAAIITSLAKAAPAVREQDSQGLTETEKLTVELVNARTWGAKGWKRFRAEKLERIHLAARVRVLLRRLHERSTSTILTGARAIGKRMAAARGWVGYEWTALDKLWSAESGWSTTANNPNSDACGIPQAMNDCAYGYSAVAQIRWGLNYIAGRYGRPSVAYSFWAANGWY